MPHGSQWARMVAIEVKMATARPPFGLRAKSAWHNMASMVAMGEEEAEVKEVAVAEAEVAARAATAAEVTVKAKVGSSHRPRTLRESHL